MRHAVVGDTPLLLTSAAAVGDIDRLGSEAALDDNRARHAALRTMSGAGHQHFVGFMRTLAEQTTADHLRAALFARWVYEDPGPSLRWDPLDHRAYAYRADDPAKSRVAPIRTVRGANRLAVEALVYFPPAAPGRGNRLATAAFVSPAGETCVQWPVWTPPVGRDTLRSLLTLPDLALADLQRDAEAQRRLLARGIAEVYRSRRFTEGRFRNFAAAEALLGVG